jgi:hypothetical protein
MTNTPGDRESLSDWDEQRVIKLRTPSEVRGPKVLRRLEGENLCYHIGLEDLTAGINEHGKVRVLVVGLDNSGQDGENIAQLFSQRMAEAFKVQGDIDFDQIKRDVDPSRPNRATWFEYIFDKMFEQGKVMLFDTETQEYYDHYVVHDKGGRGGPLYGAGTRVYSLPNGRIFRESTWKS